MALFDSSILDFAIEKGYNVLFSGHAGVGKTQITRHWFNKHALNYKIFSGATIDPWVDLVGVPKQVIDENTGTSEIELITPKHLDAENIEAIFVDEINRAPKKVQNALLELIQFKTINGRPFPNLRVIWGAMNPEQADGRSYNVYKIDDALEDRFEIKLELPYECSLEYFRGKYGEKEANIAVEWWNEIPIEKRIGAISPRRLDYALKVYKEGGDLSWILPEMSRPQVLQENLSGISVMDEISQNISEDTLEKWLRREDNSFKVNSVFNRLSSSEQREVVQNMPDEVILGNSNDPVYYANEDFTQRYSDIRAAMRDSATIEDVVFELVSTTDNAILLLENWAKAEELKKSNVDEYNKFLHEATLTLSKSIDKNPYAQDVACDLIAGIGKTLNLNHKLAKVRAWIEYLIKHGEIFDKTSWGSANSPWGDPEFYEYDTAHPAFLDDKYEKPRKLKDAKNEDTIQDALDLINPRDPEGFTSFKINTEGYSKSDNRTEAIIDSMRLANAGDIHWNSWRNIGRGSAVYNGSGPNTMNYSGFFNEIRNFTVESYSSVNASPAIDPRNNRGYHRKSWLDYIKDQCDGSTNNKVKAIRHFIEGHRNVNGKPITLKTWEKALCTIESAISNMRKDTIANNIGDELQVIDANIVNIIALHSDLSSFKEVIEYIADRYPNIFEKMFWRYHCKLNEALKNSKSFREPNHVPLTMYTGINEDVYATCIFTGVSKVDTYTVDNKTANRYYNTGTNTSNSFLRTMPYSHLIPEFILSNNWPSS